MADVVIDKCKWSDPELAAAISKSRSWRGVMRELGLCVTSARSMQVVRSHVSRLGLDTSHFSGQRRWSDEQLRRAVATAYSWRELLGDLGLFGSSGDKVRVKAHAVRLGLDLSRLQTVDEEPFDDQVLRPQIKRLREAGSAIAAMWFLLCGCSAAIPVEPSVFDLLVAMADGIKRVQVKTTTHNGKDGWVVQVGRRPYSVGNRGLLLPYDPDTLDYFFVLDGDLTMYLIPSRVLAGRVMVLLRNYTKYVVGDLGSLMRLPGPAA